ncbi:MAG: tyrosine-type recombinase/integrase [Alistipes shahii]|uniref:tyrosine-type recombinase/integrase n=1 Tax=Alistipes shahii TaxID=328814 RepID=UPI00399D2E65
MQRSTFKVLFYVKRLSEKHGQVPIMGRITINGTMSQFSCKLSVRSSLWDAKANKASGKSLESQRINENLENIKTNIGKQYQRLCDRDSYVTAEKVRNAFLGMGDDCRLLLQTFDEYLAGFLKRVGKDRAYSSYDNYRKRRNRLASFLEYEYHVKDIAFKELKREFVEKFVVYLSTVKGLASGTIHSTLKKLKLMTYTAYKNGWIAVDPFAGFYVKAEYAERRYLSASELQAVMDVRLPNYRTGINRDAFVFCAFTGLSHADVSKLTYADIHTDDNGERWIIDRRQKTGTQFRVKLLPVAEMLYERYKDMHLSGDRVFPLKGTYNTLNMSLRHVARHAGLSFNPTIHMARHTFATTVTLTQGVPLETVSKMLGHKRITTTQIYAKITNDKIGQDMAALSEKLSSVFKVAR